MSIKNIALFLFLALPMGAHADVLPIADANEAVIKACEAAGGKMDSFSAGKCELLECVYSDNKSDGKYYRSGTNKRATCTDAELDKAIEEIARRRGVRVGGNDDDNGGRGRGNRNGRDSDGDGGDGRGGRDGRGGDSAGSANGNGEMAIVCDFGTVNLKLPPDDRCYKKCTKKVNGVRVPDTGDRDCRKCIQKYHRNADGSPIVFTTDVRGTVTLPDVQVRSGEIICRDIKTGREVTVVGTKCTQPGQVIVTSGGASSGGSGGIIVVNSGGTTTTSSSSQNLPAFCLSDKKSDKKKCAEYLARQDRFRCASGSDTAGCIRDIDVIRSRYSSDCVDCDTRRRGGSSFAEILGAALPPLAMLGGAYFNSRAQIKSNEAWAGAAAVGYEQCQLMNNNYLQYGAANELPGINPQQQAHMMAQCNGYGLGQFAGLGGAFGNYYGAGYSPGFMGGMMGPYGMYNPYGGMGGMVGGAVGGYVGGMQGGYMGGYQGGMTGGLIGGGLIGGGSIGGLVQGGYAISGMNGGMAAGYPAGGYMAGGMAAGYPAGGYMAGGMAAGYPAGGYMAGGMAAGYPAGGGMNGGMAAGYPAGGYGIGGMAAGYPAGGMYAAGGMYPAGGYAGGMAYPAGGGIGGLVQGGYAISGMGGGMGYPGGMGGYPGMGGGLGGWGSGVGGAGYNPYGYGNGYGVGGMYGMQASMQASSRDAMLQQQGISYQMGMLGSGSMGAGGMTQAFGYAGYSPMNVGYGMGGYGGYGYTGM